MIHSPTDSVTKSAVLCIRETSIEMEGVWPGRYGAVALLVFTHSLANVMEATLKIAPLLKRMDKRGGLEPTQKLFRALEQMGVESAIGPKNSSISPSDMDQSAFIDGREMYEILERDALDTLGEFGGYLSRGPFVISAKLLPVQLKDRMALLSSKYRPAEGAPDTSDFT